ncbi:MAG TPA: tetratricopeptide repeat protein [Dissulfuribacter thermophilus]|uniref:Tetratricopeptide repeat protein n=1 Tax=Dissulfuribacter thermophilus TaxID=1156395 RepID=A0A7V2SUW8_9BACT|nr:tetratricopeptide repeat protein [Dissulfuribacter thermophilus]
MGGGLVRWTFWPLGGAALMVFFFLGLALAGPQASLHGVKTKYIDLSEREARARKLFEKAWKSKDLKEKERLYLEVLKLWPSDPRTYNNLGDTYERQKRFKEAIKSYETALALNPKAPYPYFGLGDVYFKLGEFERAISYYKKGLKIDPDDRPARENLTLATVLTQKVLFPFDSYRLTQEAKRVLKEIARAMNAPKLKEARFEIQGHTDSLGPRTYNMRLSVKRGEAVKRFLVTECGIKEERLTVRGYGEDRPAASNKTVEGRKRNRRVEVKIRRNHFAHFGVYKE